MGDFRRIIEAKRYKSYRWSQLLAEALLLCWRCDTRVSAYSALGTGAVGKWGKNPPPSGGFPPIFRSLIPAGNRGVLVLWSWNIVRLSDY